MFTLSLLKHKRVLKRAFSECFSPIKDEIGNVPVLMQTSKLINASILGICRGYGESRILYEPHFDLVVDSVFEEVFRRESVEVQTRTESWLTSSDEEFLFHYYQAKYRAKDSSDLTWLQNIAIQYFRPAHTVVFPL